MEALPFLILIIIISFYILFRLLKWVFTKTKRIYWALALVGVFILSLLIETVFFTKMEFIQSNVYPNLQLIKNPIRDRDSLYKLIKQKVLQKIDGQFTGNEEKFKFKYQYPTKEEPPETYLNYSLQFYEYTTGDNFMEEGTNWFIDHKEDIGGFSTTEFSQFDKYSIATFRVTFFENDTINHFGVLYYPQKGKLIKTDTLINTKH